jgi:hypothetical protein
MVDLKPFLPDDIDETLTCVVVFGHETYLMFPYINAVREAPQFNSINCVIKGPAATVADFSVLSDLIKQAGKDAKWFISFNTPWLISLANAKDISARTTVDRPRERP